MKSIGQPVFTPFLFNFSLIIAAISLVQYFLRDSKADLVWTTSRRLMAGLVLGVIGIALMRNGLRFSESITIDLRFAVFIIGTVYGGPLVSLIMGLIMTSYRLIFLGVTLNSQIASGATFFVLVSFIIIALQGWHRNKMFVAFLGSMLLWIGVASTLLNLWTLNYAFYMFLLHSINLITAYLSLNFIQYTFDSLVQYRRMKFSHDFDYLTNVHNVRYFDSEFNQQIDLANKNEWMLSLLMLDIDLFKDVNDQYGHDTGDVVLKELGKILVEQCRPTDIVARKGGEEFTIILNRCSEEQAFIIAERIRTTVQNYTFDATQNKLHITVSIGIATYPRHANVANDLLKKADVALYLAKANGRNRTEINQQVITLNLDNHSHFPQSGHEGIDFEHRNSIDQLHLITRMIQDQISIDRIKPEFVKLREAFILHCTNEEKVLTEIKIPKSQFNAHHKKHNELIGLFIQLEQRMVAKDSILDQEYVHILTKIILGHIQTDDQAYFPYLQEKH